MISLDRVICAIREKVQPRAEELTNNKNIKTFLISFIQSCIHSNLWKNAPVRKPHFNATFQDHNNNTTKRHAADSHSSIRFAVAHHRNYDGTTEALFAQVYQEVSLHIQRRGYRGGMFSRRGMLERINT